MSRFIEKAKALKGRIQNSALKIKCKMDWFDISQRLDTADDLAGQESVHGHRYTPTETSQFEKALNQLIRMDKTVLDGTFIDFGCGKGRVLIMAARMGFKHVAGIEYSKHLYEICCQNLKKVKLFQAKVTCVDAVAYQIPSDAKTFYFYNPFEYCILEKVLDNIRNSLRTNVRDGYIVYVDPKNFGSLDPKLYKLLFKNDGPIQPFHIYKVLNNVS